MRRLAVVVVALGVAAAATPSLAGTSKSCMLIRDAAGDATEQPNMTIPGVNQPELDIVSADVASDARSVTTVVRVQRLGSALEAPGRRNQYRFSFHFGGYGDVITYAYRGIDGEKFHVTVPTEGQETTKTLLPATGAFDVARNEVRVTIPLAQARGNRIPRKKTYFTNLSAESFRGVGPVAGPVGGVGVATGMDQASTKARYLAGSPSCVRVGR